MKWQAPNVRECELVKLDRSLIAESPAFAGLSADALDEVLRHATPMRLPKDEAAFQQGEAAKRFFLLLNGHLRVTRLNPQGHQMVVRFIAPGEMFGVAMAINSEKYPGTATAMVESLALAWPNAIWADLIAHYPKLATNAMQALGSRIQDSQRRILDLTTKQVEQRIADAVITLANQAGRTTDDGIVIDFPLSRLDLAEMAGATHHTVSRTLSAWESRGLVECGRKRLMVRDLEALKHLAENND